MNNCFVHFMFSRNKKKSYAVLNTLIKIQFMCLPTAGRTQLIVCTKNKYSRIKMDRLIRFIMSARHNVARSLEAVNNL